MIEKILSKLTFFTFFVCQLKAICHVLGNILLSNNTIASLNAWKCSFQAFKYVTFIRTEKRKRPRKLEIHDFLRKYDNFLDEEFIDELMHNMISKGIKFKIHFMYENISMV